MEANDRAIALEHDGDSRRSHSSHADGRRERNEIRTLGRATHSFLAGPVTLSFDTADGSGTLCHWSDHP
jgi:hypothetical protein